MSRISGNFIAGTFAATLVVCLSGYQARMSLWRLGEMVLGADTGSVPASMTPTITGVPTRDHSFANKQYREGAAHRVIDVLSNAAGTITVAWIIASRRRSRQEIKSASSARTLCQAITHKIKNCRHTRR